MSEASNKNTTPDATSNTTPATPAATPAKKPDQRQRGPRPPADARGRAANPGQGGARAAGSPQPSARPQGAQPARGPRTERTDNDNAARPPRAARPEGARDQQPRAAQQQQARGPRPEGAPGPQARGPRPDGTAEQQRGPRPDGAPRGQRGPRLTPEEQAAKAAEKAFRNPLPPITYPEDLPVSGGREEIAKAFLDNQVIIVSGETGSGKTTQLPKICLELGRGQKGLIGHTQPRRIAASSTAKRIAQELGSAQGVHVGFKVRFTDTLTKGASVKLMTDGILLAETQTDPLLKNYDTIIIDEAHERSLNIDFLLGYLKQ